MNTGAKNKRKAGLLHVHQVGTSTIAEPSSDLRRTRTRSQNVGKTSKALPSDSQASEDLRTLQAVDDIGSFSYLLGEQFPIFPDETDYPGVNDDTIHITLKEKRNDNSVRNDSTDISRNVKTDDEHRTSLWRHGCHFGTNTWMRCCDWRDAGTLVFTTFAAYVERRRWWQNIVVRSRSVRAGV